MASINSAKSEALSLTIKLRNQTSRGGRWFQMALNSNVIIRNNLNKYLREEYFTKRLLYQDHIHIIEKYKIVQNVMTCSVVSHDFSICNHSKPLKIKVNHKFNFPTYKIENKFETISSSSSLIIATVISTSGRMKQK